MTNRPRVLDLMRADPGLTGEELRERLPEPNGTVSSYRPESIRADRRAQELLAGDGDFPQRRFPVAIIDRNIADDSAVVVRKRRA